MLLLYGRVKARQELQREWEVRSRTANFEEPTTSQELFQQLSVLDQTVSHDEPRAQKKRALTESAPASGRDSKASTNSTPNSKDRGRPIRPKNAVRLHRDDGKIETRRCNNCNEIGHLQARCPRKDGGQRTVTVEARAGPGGGSGATAVDQQAGKA